MSPPIFEAHVCEAHEDLMRYVIETRNDVKHLVKSIDELHEHDKQSRKEWEAREAAALSRVSALEKVNDEKIGEERIAGKFSAAVAFIVSLVVSLVAVAVAWIAK
jgi:S-adenosylmethionine:diacylglycerol 3-amino-3-carboxypropyl transferase